MTNLCIDWHIKRVHFSGSYLTFLYETIYKTIDFFKITQKFLHPLDLFFNPFFRYLQVNLMTDQYKWNLYSTFFLLSKNKMSSGFKPF